MGHQLSPLVISALLSIGFGYPALILAKRLNILDVPGSAPHKTHARPTPLAGGILVMVTFFLMAILSRQWLSREILGVFAGAIIIFAFGVWDDRKGLSAGPKLVGQFVASAILISSGVQVYFMTILSNAGYISPFIAQALNILITVFWLTGITNALNMIDSMDGIVAGLGIIASAFFWGATRIAGQDEVAFWAAVMLGTSLGLYFWNNTVSKFFLGDSGAQTIGFLLASFGILYNPLDRSPESSWIVPIMLLGVPIFDTTLVVLSRSRRKQAIGSGRLDHTYHRLIALGIPPKNAVLITHITAMTVSGLAFLTLYLPPFIALTFFLATLICGLILLLWMERKPTLDSLND
jgi:UDP-GlcNAc:undecaprenyl-phosphate/decaprenyl-phosphate GlcNAc-1-phosphate transferase